MFQLPKDHQLSNMIYQELVNYYNISLINVFRVFIALALCAVFGDPHVITLDSVWYSFQGTCDYVLSRDNCGPEDGAPTYELTSTFYRKYPNADKDASWVKSVKLNIFNHVSKQDLDGLCKR